MKSVGAHIIKSAGALINESADALTGVLLASNKECRALLVTVITNAAPYYSVLVIKSAARYYW